MHVGRFTFCMCVYARTLGPHRVNTVLKNGLSARGAGDDRGKTDGNQNVFLSHSSLFALTPMGYFMWIYGAYEGWCFRKRFEKIHSGPFFVAPPNCNYTV